MKNVRNVFLFTSIFVAHNNIYAMERNSESDGSNSTESTDANSISFQRNQSQTKPSMLTAASLGTISGATSGAYDDITAQRIDSFASTYSDIPPLTNPQPTANGANSSADGTSSKQGSTARTKLWYGLMHKIGVTSKTDIYKELYDKGILEVDVNNDLVEATSRLERALKDNLRDANLDSPEIQNNLYEIITIAETLKDKTGVKFEMHEGFAKKAYPSQKAALTRIIIQFATVDQPQLQREKEAAILLANVTYNSKISDLLLKARKAAVSSRYFKDRSKDTDDFDVHNEAHYTSDSLDPFESLLESKRKELVQAQEQLKSATNALSLTSNTDVLKKS